MASKKYDELADAIVGLVGGKDNISYFTHCVTRLRFNVKDKGLVDTKAVDRLANVMGSQWSGDQYQVIVGQEVGDVYREVCERHGFALEDALDENLDAGVLNKRFAFTPKAIISGFADIIAGSLIPFIPVLIGAGMIKVIVLLLTTFGLLDEASSTYSMLMLVGDAGFYFLPVFIGKGAAQKFGADEGLGMFMALMLLSPTFVSLVADGAPITLFGLPVYAGSYSYMVFPVILCCAVMAPVERFFKKHSPEMLRVIVQPLGTILVMIPLAFVVLAPLGSILGTYLTAFLMWLYDTTGFVGMAILGALYPLLVITGMHNATTPYWLESFTKFGYEPIVSPIDCLNNINQGVAALATAVKSKRKNVTSTGITCGVTAIVAGISEPALFGNNLRYKVPLIGACVGNFIGAGACGLLNVYCYSVYGTGGMFAIPCYIGPDLSNLLFYLLSMALGAAVTFVVTYVFYKDEAVS